MLKPESIIGLMSLVTGCVLLSVGLTHLHLHQDVEGLIGFTILGAALAVFGAFLSGYSFKE